MELDNRHEKLSAGDKEALVEIEEIQGHQDYSEVFDMVVRDEKVQNEIIMKALKAEADREEAKLLAMEAIAKAKRSASQ